jgi:N-acetylglucosamine kinase-like BadF-type ATPase
MPKAVTNYFLAIDAGGTKSVLVLADEERQLARTTTGSIKRMRVSADEARHNLETALQTLSRVSGVALYVIARTCVGAAGASVDLVADWINSTLKDLVGGDVLLCGDDQIALDAAFNSGAGVLVIAGTGQNTIGRDSAGRLVHAGGWGPALGDEGSGYWIGQQTLRRVFHAYDEDGRRGTPLLMQRILDAWHLHTVDELVEYANRTPPPDFAALTPVIAAVAAEGDPISQSVLELAGRELAALVLLVYKQLRQSDPAALPPVACTGSVLENIPAVRAAMTADLRVVHPEIKVLPGMVEPVLGALWRARNNIR